MRMRARTAAKLSGALVYGANFSIGVNLFYRITRQAAALFAAVEGYSPFIEEAHHSRKRDAPSGTAIRLRELMVEHLGPEIPTSSTRASYIPGTHRVGFDSEADQVLLTHTARSRQGFASGALLAAHWIVGRTGVFEFGEVIDEVLKQ
jgi:4-hydroxy-tetrahydrodipicolinate reductase